MTKKDKQDFLILGALAIVILLLPRQKKITFAVDFLHEDFRSIILNTSLASNIFDGEQYYIKLAKIVDWQVTKEAYYSAFGSYLDTDLVLALTPNQFATFTNELTKRGINY